MTMAFSTFHQLHFHQALTGCLFPLGLYVTDLLWHTILFTCSSQSINQYASSYSAIVITSGRTPWKRDRRCTMNAEKTRTYIDDGVGFEPTNSKYERVKTSDRKVTLPYAYCLPRSDCAPLIQNVTQSTAVIWTQDRFCSSAPTWPSSEGLTSEDWEPYFSHRNKSSSTATMISLL
jgi:hypothetical protein